MKKLFALSIVSLGLLIGIFTVKSITANSAITAETATRVLDTISVIDSSAAQEPCNLPDQPQHIGLQVGHWKNDELPEELVKLRNSHGAYGGGKMEWEVAHTIASLTKAELEANGYTVDLLPATVPPDYCAHVFVSIHADSSTDTTRTGYKAATYWRDQTGRGQTLVEDLESAYQSVGLPYEPTVTTNMRGYYAFNNRRFEHAIHPETPGAIFETGFLTNPGDAALLINEPEKPANALAEGIIKFLQQ